MRIERRRPSLGECFANHTHTHYGPPDEIENVPRRGREQHIRVAFEVLRGLNSSGTAVHLIGMSLRPARAIKLSHFRDALHVNVMVEFISRLFCWSISLIVSGFVFKGALGHCKFYIN